MLVSDEEHAVPVLDAWATTSSHGADSTVHIKMLPEPSTCPALQASVYNDQIDISAALFCRLETTSPYKEDVSRGD